MDPVVVQAGTALVKLMATDVWTGAKDLVVGWWGKHHPDQAEQVGADLDQLHAEVVDAGADTEVREALAGEWQARLRRLVAANPDLAVELHRLLTEQLTPLLGRTHQTTTLTQTATVDGNRNTTIQAGRDIHGLPNP
ncbi:hypothetical protein KO481_04725 [Nocardia sp. NEAU-G5]|uniref:Uncharacterized protein n=1 Tax=Nocardia albiluteola TaxID=2842303 RepID=A0ABS6AS22_9NOCA|nr:hypothetical protein [Nocardia albiluteola]MBU3060829.1 hypothetical protein [Nocardia albiluteola]